MVAEAVVLGHQAPVPLKRQMLLETKGCWWNGVKCGWHLSKRPAAAASKLERARSFLGTLNALGVASFYRLA